MSIFRIVFVFVLFLVCSENYLGQNQCNIQRIHPFTGDTLTLYKDVLFQPNQIKIFQNLTYASNVVGYEDTTDLKFDAYIPPNPSVANLPPRPVVIFAHGGGHTGGDKQDDYSVEVCTQLAQRGIVALSMDYRIGYMAGCGDGNSCCLERNLTDAMRALYFSVQDQRALLRYLMNYIATDNSQYLDSNAIFLSGTSSGGITALHTLFLDSTEIGSLYTSHGGLDDIGLFPDQKFDIAGVLCFSGFIFKKWMIDFEEATPLFIQHGTCDRTISLYDNYLYHCDENNPVFKVSGPLDYKDRLDLIGNYYDMTIVQNGDHGTNSNAAHIDNQSAFIRDVLCGNTLVSKYDDSTYYASGNEECNLDMVQKVSCSIPDPECGDYLDYCEDTKPCEVCVVIDGRDLEFPCDSSFVLCAHCVPIENCGDTILYNCNAEDTVIFCGNTIIPAENVKWLEEYYEETCHVYGENTKVDSFREDRNFVLFPNPSNNQFTVESIQELFDDQSLIQIFNLNGILVMKKKPRPHNKYFTVKHELIPGLYYVRINNSESHKIVVQ